MPAQMHSEKINTSPGPHSLRRENAPARYTLPGSASEYGFTRETAAVLENQQPDVMNLKILSTATTAVTDMYPGTR